MRVKNDPDQDHVCGYVGTVQTQTWRTRYAHRKTHRKKDAHTYTHKHTVVGTELSDLVRSAGSLLSQ